MPMYSFRCGRCQQEFETFLPVTADLAHQGCPRCANGMGLRKYKPFNGGFEEVWPIESVTLGVPPWEAEWRQEHYRKMGCPVEFASNGDAILTGPSHRAKFTAIREREYKEAREIDSEREKGGTV